LEEGKNLSDASALVPTVQIIRRSPTVSDRGAEFNLILGKEVSVSATVYDVTGRVVKVVADQVVMPAGDHRITWDGTTNRGGRAGSGVYIVKLRAEKEQLTENIVLLR
jgi:flagellar hook assembly protein FlgD